MEKERKVLNFNLYDKDVYNSYGVDDKPLLNDELAYTIEERANNHKINTKLSINFKKYKESPINEEDFLDAYKNSFSSRIKAKTHELSRCLITGLIMLFVGIAILLFDVFVAEEFFHYFWFEFFNVIAWVFCWGGVEVLTVELIQIKMEIGKLEKLTKAEISFTEEEFKQKKTTKGVKEETLPIKPTVAIKKSAKF